MSNPKILLVEGDTEKRLIPELMEQNGINWGVKKKTVVDIKAFGGYQRVTIEDAISTAFKNSDLTALGIVVDADEFPKRRWQSIRNICLQKISNIPDPLPETGLIMPNAEVNEISDKIKFGIWMMPDNKERGMLETFLAYLLPDTGDAEDPLWGYTEEAIAQAKQKGAPFKDVHRDKAKIHTWLAWQDEPGRQLHQAVKQRILDPNHPRGQAFVRWFKALYDL